jgi:hypothetical protein
MNTEISMDQWLVQLQWLDPCLSVMFLFAKILKNY